MRFELFIAARYLRAKRRQAVIGVITAISVLGVAAGVASLIIALAITNGMRRDLQERLVGSTAHVELMRTNADGIRGWQPLLARLKALPHVTAAAPGLWEQVLVARGARSSGALIKGVVPADEQTVSDLLKTVTDGSAEELEPLEKMGGSGRASLDAHLSAIEPREDGAPDSMPGSTDPLITGKDIQSMPSIVPALPPIVIGRDMADSVGAHVGDTVTVISPQGEMTPFGLVPRYQKIFGSGNLQVGILPVRLGLCLYPAGGRTAVVL